MKININISEEQEKAILTKFVSIEAYLQQMIDNRAWRIMNDIVRGYAKGQVELDVLTANEQKIFDKIKNRIITNVDNLPKDVKALIVKRAKVKSAVEKQEDEIL